MLLTRSPLGDTRRCPSLDLHVLSTPPAFVLSQDQTLREKIFIDRDPTGEPEESDRSSGVCPHTRRLETPNEQRGSRRTARIDRVRENYLIIIWSPHGKPRRTVDACCLVFKVLAPLCGRTPQDRMSGQRDSGG